MNEPSQDLVVVPEISLEKVWNCVLEVDQGRDGLNSVGLGLLGVVNFNLSDEDYIFYLSKRLGSEFFVMRSQNHQYTGV